MILRDPADMLACYMAEERPPPEVDAMIRARLQIAAKRFSSVSAFGDPESLSYDRSPAVGPSSTPALDLHRPSHDRAVVTRRDRPTGPDDEPPTRTKVETAARQTATHRRLGRLALVVVEGPDKGKQHHIEVSRGRVVKAGRSVTNELVIHDELVSDMHFELIVQDQGICLRDLNSTNGVYVHGLRVLEALLDVEAVFRVGNTSIKIVSTTTVSVAVSTKDHFGEFYGNSPVMREAFADLERVAVLAERLPVLITGETGTGKALVARGLHDASPRAAGPFVVLDCSALPRELAESHILGHVRGAFPGAVREHAGLFEQAHGGTLFIDELGELPLELQAKLLRPLDCGEIVRLSDSTVRKVNIRVIAATHRDLRLMMHQAKFRDDLYYRLVGKIVEIPALRERGDDIVLLARRFLNTTCKRNSLPPKELSPAACAALLRGAWPGNVRQLKATIECAALTTTQPVLEPTDLRLDDTSDTAGPCLDVSSIHRLPLAQVTEEFEHAYYKSVLKRVGVERGWEARGAKVTGLDHAEFIKTLRRLGLYSEQTRKSSQTESERRSH